MDRARDPGRGYPRRPLRPENGEGIGTFQRVSFLADDVEATWRELAKRGVEFTQEPKTESWGTAAGFKDPDGNTFVLSSK